MKLRVGLIGVGNQWQTRHAPALRAMSDRFEVRVACDEIERRAECAADQFGARTVSSYRALAEQHDIDAVLMLAPQWYGTLPMFAACDSGKAVYSAVVLEYDMREAMRLKKRVESSGIAFMAELPNRYAPATLRLKELIATHLGAPRLIFCQGRAASRAEDSAECQASAPMDNMVELVDWCRYIVAGEPTSVVSVAHSLGQAPERCDHELLSLRFPAPQDHAEAVTAHISFGNYLPAAWTEAATFRQPAALQVVCDNGVAYADLPSTLTWFDCAGRHQESLDGDRPVGEQMLAQFFRAVTSLVQRSSDLEDAYRSMAIVLAARKSQEDERRVPLVF
jgi:predicted dehydrogenase